MSALEDALAPLTDAEEKKVHAPEDKWTDAFALKVTVQDFTLAENYRRTNHDWRWQQAEELYYGFERQRVWKGTKIPRASLGMYVVFQQVESLLPKVLSTIFADNPWFEVGAQPGTSAQDAIEARDLMLYQFQLSRQRNNQSVREVVRRSIKSGFLYGNGIVELYWEEWLRKLRKLYRQQVPEVVRHPMLGIPMPTGRVKNVIGERTIERTDQFPCLKNVSIKDFFIDPLNETPQVQTARFAIKRAYKTVDELEALRDVEGFKIPPRDVLLDLANDKNQAQSDVSKQWAESARDVSYQPSLDTSVDPAAKRIEVLNDWRKDRSVWTLNREYTVYNGPNEYGFIPLFNAFYTDSLDRFYGVSVADVTEGEHRLQGGLVNLRLDEQSLGVHGRIVKKRGFSIPAGQLNRRPNQVIEVENPKTDIVFDQTQNVTQTNMMEVAASELRVQKVTGITDLAIMGTQSSGGNSANRTATGVGAQVQAAFSRITYLIENLEDTFIEPILSAHHFMNTQFLDPEAYIRIMNPNGDEVEIDPLTVLNSDVVFTMRASAKMQARMAIMQMFGPLVQALLNPALLDKMAEQGLTVDMSEIVQVWIDSTGYKSRTGKIVRKMSPQEMQAHKEAKAQQISEKQKLQDSRMRDLKTLQDDQNDADLQKEIVSKGLEAALTPDEEETPE